MSFIFVGICFICVGIVICKKDITLLKSTKELLKNMGICNNSIFPYKSDTTGDTKGDTKGDNEKFIELINKTIEYNNDKETFIENIKEVCKELIKKRNQRQRDKKMFMIKMKTVCDEIKQRNNKNFFFEWINKITNYGKIEPHYDFILVSENELSSLEDSDEECLLPEK